MVWDISSRYIYIYIIDLYIYVYSKLGLFGLKRAMPVCCKLLAYEKFNHYITTMHSKVDFSSKSKPEDTSLAPRDTNGDDNDWLTWISVSWKSF